MKQQWWAYIIVAVLSIGAGVAIAGLPDNVPVDATIIPPSTTEAPEPTLPERPDPTTTTAPATTTAAPSTTVAPAPTDPPTPETTEAPAPEIPDRSEFAAVVANGANVSGAATRFADLLEGLGYVDVPALNGTTIAEVTTVYHAPGLEAAAARMAQDLGIPPEAIAPLEASPPVIDLPAGSELVAYIGRDLAL